MAAYRDLASCNYFGENWATRLVAVGWLESREELTPGAVEERFFGALISLLVAPWQPFVSAGRHACTMCRFTGGPASLRFRGNEVAIGSANLFVLDQQRAYVAPSLIAHYVDAHAYSPPLEFQHAVLASPPMKSMEYYKLLRKHKIDQIAKVRTAEQPE